MYNFINFEGINILPGDRNSIFKYIISRIENDDKLWVITLNALMYMEYIKKTEYHNAVNNSTFSIADGVGIVKLLKKHDIITERYPGIELFKDLCRYSGNKYGIYLLGTGDENLKACSENIKRDFKGNVCGIHSGFFSEEEEDSVVEDINRSGADFLFVGMGIPKQEIFILRNFERINARLFMGVGGSFDVVSGKIKRAPAFFQKTGNEWLYRMIAEPHRFKKLPDLMKFYMNIYLKK